MQCFKNGSAFEDKINELIQEFHQHAENIASSGVSLCVCCCERPAHVAVVPCGHRCFCTDAECSDVEACPLCRTPMTGTLRIF